MFRSPHRRHRAIPTSPVLVLALILALGGVLVSGAAAAVPDAEAPFVRLETDAGEILLVLFPDLAPHHVASFLHLAASGFYEGTYFHRIIPTFMIQGGAPNTKDFDPRNDGQGNPGLADVVTAAERAQLEAIAASLAERGYVGLDLNTQVFLKAEFSRTAKHLRGTLSMARRARPVDSAGSQFFLCHERSQSTAGLDGQYTVFGHVVAGMDVVDRIATAAKDPRRGADQPAAPVKINRCVVTTGVETLSPPEQAAYREVLKTLAAEGSTW